MAAFSRLASIESCVNITAAMVMVGKVTAPMTISTIFQKVSNIMVFDGWSSVMK
ncbi:hypothetical protein D1872_289770 [compost metagenome]